MKNLFDIVSHFEIQGTINDIKPLGAGLINDTYKVTTAETDAPDYVLQRINHAIFQNVEMLQNNIASVTNHIRRKLTEQGETDIDRKVLTFVKADGGKTYWHDGENYWRIMVFIPRAKTYETVNPEYSYYAGVAFGDFQAKLADIPETLGETIPDFHNMEFRLKQLRDAVATNAAGRLAEVQYYIDEIEKRADEMCKAERMYREGKLPKRVCHCDTKVNNMMFDEDDKDLNRVNFNMEIFKAFTKGYLEGARSFLTPIEIENLPYAAALFPYMQCVRFLADCINGDTYYKIKYPEHNLVRTKAQFKLLQSVEEHTPEMTAFIRECLG